MKTKLILMLFVGMFINYSCTTNSDCKNAALEKHVGKTIVKSEVVYNMMMLVTDQNDSIFISIIKDYPNDVYKDYQIKMVTKNKIYFTKKYIIGELDYWNLVYIGNGEFGEYY